MITFTQEAQDRIRDINEITVSSFIELENIEKEDKNLYLMNLDHAIKPVLHRLAIRLNNKYSYAKPIIDYNTEDGLNLRFFDKEKDCYMVLGSEIVTNEMFINFGKFLGNKPNYENNRRNLQLLDFERVGVSEYDNPKELYKDLYLWIWEVIKGKLEEVEYLA